MLETVRRAAQELTIAIVRPYTLRELPGWGKIYTAGVGDFRRDWLWSGAPIKTVREKASGRVMNLDISKWADRSIYFLGRWYDLATQLIVDDFISSGDTVIDVGVNRGMFSFYVSHRVGSGGKVISFEPNPDCVNNVQDEIKTNNIGNIKIYNVGLGDTESELTLFVPDINHGEATFGRSAYTNGRQVIAQVKVGDDLLRNETPSFIKIDVEGFECKVLAGLKATIGRCGPIVLTEMAQPQLTACGASSAELVSIVTGYGYRGFAVELNKTARGYTWKLTDIATKPPTADVLWLSPASLDRHSDLIRAHS